jgi:cellulose biosynthesis protein BcsQ
MILSAWSDKGGTGKTTAAILAAAHFRAALIDLDPQGDAARWAEKGGHSHEHLVLGAPGVQERLIAAAQAPELVVVDCPPGREGVAGMAFAQFVIVPTRSGDADLVALARALATVRQVQAHGNPELQVGVVLNAIRETGRARGVAQALRVSSGYHYLGEIKERLVYEEAYSAGSGTEALGGPALEEMATVMSKVAEVLLPTDQRHQHSAA